MVTRYILFLFLMLGLNFQVLAEANPFAKIDKLNIGKDIAWKINKGAKFAVKTSPGHKGTYYHLFFDNRQLKLLITADAAGKKPKSFTQLEITNLKIDGKQSPLFKWCLVNQERHSRFLQQGLSVRKNICEVNGDAGAFILRLNKATLEALQKGKRLSIVLKPFRTPLELNYDISDFGDMYLALNAKPAAAVAAPVAASKPAGEIKKKCWAGPPAKYRNIKPVEYECGDAAAKIDAERWITNLVNKEKEKEKKLLAEQERQRKLAEEKKQAELAAKLKQEEALKAEAAAIAASEAKQAQINLEIKQKMLKVCKKYWDKGEHRCYCQKYIDEAPAAIRAKSTCE